MHVEVLIKGTKLTALIDTAAQATFLKAKDSESFKLKKAKKLEEEIEYLKKLNHSLKEENNKLKQEKESLDNKVEELEMKIAEKEVLDYNDIPLMVLSEELTIKDVEIAQLKADVNKLEKKLQP
ncbi:hypothetical protein TNCT_728441 [Trichonephila clavata]|uniref:Uncharacterized protein n=1 Tax=Trichonephila clavata TaxID=2740835 RepID=A0A8X6GNP4_TRICU|nr:hypothetical protein TNCT_728441 [Trichonephila clavata]